MIILNKKRFPTLTKNGIYGFYEDYRWLSNMYTTNVDWYDGYSYPSSETIYQMEKLRGIIDDDKLYEIFNTLDGYSSKKEIKKYKDIIRPEWHLIKNGIMYEILYKKFTDNNQIKSLLISTNNLYLEETNNWGDTYWGKIHNVSTTFVENEERIGSNILGILLMSIRKRLVNENLNGVLNYV